MELRLELIIYGYYRDIFKNDIPNDVYTICNSYSRPISDLLMHITKIQVRMLYGVVLFLIKYNNIYRIYR